MSAAAPTNPACGAPRAALRFGVTAAFLSACAFGALRLSLVQEHVLGPLTACQYRLAVAWLGEKPQGLFVDTSCSGADLLALCLATTLVYPAPWRRRLLGAVLGGAWLLALNTVRIATLGKVVGTPLFSTLHLYVWPAALVLLTLGYVGAWMWLAEKAACSEAPLRSPLEPRVRLVIVSAVCVGSYLALAPWLLGLGVVQAWTVTIANVAAAIMSAFGLPASHGAGVLRVGQAHFLVTPECVTTPVMPLYLAALLALPLSRTRRAIGFALFVPLFFVLAVVRLLTVALPPTVVKGPLLLTHGFHQIVLGALTVAVVIAASRASVTGGFGPRPVIRRVLAAWATALALATVFGSPYNRLVTSGSWLCSSVAPHALVDLTRPGEIQGAWALLPAYQSILWSVLWVGTFGARGKRRLSAGLALLYAAQVSLLVGAGEMRTHGGLEIPTLVLRGWALAAPLLLFVLLSRRSAEATVQAAPERDPDRRGYRRFWASLGDRFPDLGGAVSTEYYRANEQRLFREFFPDLARSRVLKTDLWDEAKNTRILQWAAAQGASVFGIDVSEPTLKQARSAFADRALRATVSDVRRLPFREDSFDAIYSMGTIEHFLDPEVALAEMYRVLRPGGRAIVGVPNRWDPFLRPLLVAALFRVGLYAYGYEKSFSRSALRRMVEAADFRTVAETGLLFMPGWLRMLELACRQVSPSLGRMVGAGVRPFAWLDLHLPFVRRHGYLIAVVVMKPPPPDASAS